MFGGRQPSGTTNYRRALREIMLIAGALALLVVTFNQLSYEALVHDLFLSWSWWRAAGWAVAGYVVGLAFSMNTSPDLRWPVFTWTRVRWLVWAATGSALLVWANYGTHLEGGDPLFSGGDRVADFEPTWQERDVAGARVFFMLALAGTAGAFVVQRVRCWHWHRTIAQYTRKS